RQDHSGVLVTRQAGDKADLGICDLRSAAFTAQLAHRFDNVVGARHITVREMTAMRIHWEGTAWSHGAAFQEVGPLSVAADAQIFHLDKEGGREAIVYFGEIEIF